MLDLVIISLGSIIQLRSTADGYQLPHNYRIIGRLECVKSGSATNVFRFVLALAARETASSSRGLSVILFCSDSASDSVHSTYALQVWWLYVVPFRPAAGIINRCNIDMIRELW